MQPDAGLLHFAIKLLAGNRGQFDLRARQLLNRCGIMALQDDVRGAAIHGQNKMGDWTP